MAILCLKDYHTIIFTTRPISLVFYGNSRLVYISPFFSASFDASSHTCVLLPLLTSPLAPPSYLLLKLSWMEAKGFSCFWIAPASTNLIAQLLPFCQEDGIHAIAKGKDQSYAENNLSPKSCYRIEGYTCVESEPYVNTLSHPANLRIGVASTFTPITETNDFPHLFFEFTSRRKIQRICGNNKEVTGNFKQRLKVFNLIGVGDFGVSPSSLPALASFIVAPVLIQANRRERWSIDIVTLWKLDSRRHHSSSTPILALCL
ncbi:hypothetical protein E3N88_12830 [Mikania micrantha]|uniref:Uncharacterized protein n=1 Tax=Mikania micrantha TaxID=192012 RepID=A0A5N6P6P9_9ASTR|nr:hypothetical protein E3N88_12830 [Mikania micrantha]